MLRIAICDDEKPMRDYLGDLTGKFTDSQVTLFERGEELINCKMEFDIILLDISLDPDGKDNTPNGIEVARHIRQKSNAIIIFITALKEYVFDVFDVGAFHYLLKPVDEQKFEEVIKRAAASISIEQQKKPLVIKCNGSYVEIPIEKIIYAENEARKIILYTQNMKSIKYSFYEKMEVLEKRLGDGFFRSHRGYLVNLAEVSRYDNANIFLKNGAKVYLAKQKHPDFVAAYMDYLRRL